MVAASALAPAFLVALDVLVDPNFQRSVVLMLEHDPAQGALGLVVNRGTDVPLAQLCKTQSLRWLGDPSRRIDWGGPVGEDSGWVLLDDVAAEGVEATPLVEGLHWARSREALKRIAENPALTSRVLLGYAGWGAGQLEAEIAAGEPAGLGGSPDLYYALELAEHGDVTLAPDYPNFGDYKCDPYATATPAPP